MKAHTVTTGETTVIAATGVITPYSIHNAGVSTVYLKWDGDAAAVSSTLGYPLLTNTGINITTKHAVTCISATGGEVLRVQGAPA